MRFAEFHPIETERLLLRQLQLGDVYEYYERLFGDGDWPSICFLNPIRPLWKVWKPCSRS